MGVAMAYDCISHDILKKESKPKGNLNIRLNYISGRKKRIMQYLHSVIDGTLSVIYLVLVL